jgi:hypothetical protein
MSVTRETVESIDRERQETWWRPGVDGVRRKGVRQPASVVKAKARLRTARWRVLNDQARRPEANVVAMALLRALVQSELRELTERERGIVARALVDLQEQGYSLGEVLRVCRRVREQAFKENGAPTVAQRSSGTRGKAGQRDTR